ncbi:hypothetical protein C8A05DRAFT_19310 [Staphylotrichum tortipilum]|uniref:Uncharacterized protein n=1 Tax=Staphylotrichum tortipilum TaxID=2831512 RepID=A0AAN6MDP1_9PEZI|nr:hypothetical protein C8A05DRAFT_19310 [Staphylotrichum longicolle]
MEDAGLSVEAGFPDQLDQTDQFELDPNLDLDATGFDFGLDASDPQAELLHTGFTPNETAALTPDPQLDYAGEEEPAQAPESILAQATVGGGEPSHDAEAEAEYREEIGYEEEDLVTADAVADSNPVQAGKAEATSPNSAPSSGHADRESAQLADETNTESLAHDQGVSWGHGVDFELDDDAGEEAALEYSEMQDDLPLESLNDETANEQDDAGEEAALEYSEMQDDLPLEHLNDETANEEDAADHPESDMAKAPEDVVQPSDQVPEIEVLYNEEYYSLFGSSNDDPDSYFLSESQNLDCPLSEFLSALRAVVADDLAPTDELVVRFEPLDLEFGERSNEKFLNRCFREILDCHTTLGRVPGISTDRIINLSVRRDCEEHLLDLLAQAELVKSSPSSAEDSEMSENLDEEPQADHADEMESHEEHFEDGDLDEYHEDVGPSAPNQVENANEQELEDAHSRETVKEPVQDEQASAGSPVASAEHVEAEEHSDDVPAGAIPDEVAQEEPLWEEQMPEEGAGEEQSWDDRAAEDDSAVSQYSAEKPEEPTHPHEEQEDGNDFFENPDYLLFDDAAASGEGGNEQEAGPAGKFPSSLSPALYVSLHNNSATIPKGQGLHGAPSLIAAFEPMEDWEIDYWDDDDQPTSNHVQGGDQEANKATHQDDDLIIAFDEDTGVAAIHEEVDQYEDDTITYDTSGYAADDAQGDDEQEGARIATGSASKSPESEAQVTTAEETASVHTSTTINGDEIDYDDENGAVDLITPHDEDEPSAPGSSANNDEIDWENDEDEDEQQPANGDEGAEDGESKAAALASPSVSGKRGRTDETESLADETGMPACPSPKRMRLR